jgi:UDP-glucose 4-epimerase
MIDWRGWYRERPVLVLGAAGFLGRHLSRVLDGCGARLTLTATTPHSFAHLLAPSERVSHLVCDVREADSVEAAVRGQEVVFNLAGRSGSVASTEHPAIDAQVNLLGALAVLEAVRLQAPRAKVVFPGSRLEYGRVERLPVPEDAPLLPLNPYGVHKLAAEHHHLNYARVFGLRTTVLRITIPFGAHSTPVGRDSGVANRFIELGMDNRTLQVYGEGCQVRDYVYVDDAIEALALAGASEASDGRVYNVGGGEGIRLVEFARLVIREAGGGRLERVPWPPLAWAVETGDFVADIGRIRAELGWEPRVPLDEGVRRAIARFRRAEGAEPPC